MILQDVDGLLGGGTITLVDSLPEGVADSIAISRGIVGRRSLRHLLAERRIQVAVAGREAALPDLLADPGGFFIVATEVVMSRRQEAGKIPLGRPLEAR